MNILDGINSSGDIKNLSPDQLEPLCREIRQFLIENVSKTGGHLASNLGTVELTVALHRVYDSSVDRIIFDVGHQSYTHKIITGRKDRFNTLRQHNGLSGFPKPYESVDDAFVAGHASTSVSVAVGMARARKANNENYNVVAVIGDGAITGGLAYEGLEDAATSKEPMVIILNDNTMSISKNVGGVSDMLSKMRYRSSYINFKRWYRNIFLKMPRLYRANHKVKEWLKSWLLPTNTFSELGFEYLGPVDGHDIKALENVLTLAKDMNEPVIVHILTKKGKGYKFAEEHPEKFHGIGPFDIETGEPISSSESFSDKFGEYLCEFAAGNDKIYAITAAMSDGTGLNAFQSAFPQRFIDVGITEGHAVTMSAAMAKQGAIPVFAVYSSFLQRAYDMLIHDVALQKLHVVFGVDRAGLVGNDGETHHGVFDVNYLGSVPGMTIYCPASFKELHDMLSLAIFETDGPVAVRYPRGGESEYVDSCCDEERLIKEGKDLTIVCYGTMINEALKAERMLSAVGIDAEIIKLGMIKPNDFSLTMDSLRKTGKLLISEDVCAVGSVGRLILATAYQRDVSIKCAKLLNLDEGIVPQGTVAQLMRDFEIDAEGIAKAAREMCEDR